MKGKRNCTPNHYHVSFPLHVLSLSSFLSLSFCEASIVYILFLKKKLKKRKKIYKKKKKGVMVLTMDDIFKKIREREESHIFKVFFLYFFILFEFFLKIVI